MGRLKQIETRVGLNWRQTKTEIKLSVKSKYLLRYLCAYITYRLCSMRNFVKHEASNKNNNLSEFNTIFQASWSLCCTCFVHCLLSYNGNIWKTFTMLELMKMYLTSTMLQDPEYCQDYCQSCVLKTRELGK